MICITNGRANRENSKNVQTGIRPSVRHSFNKDSLGPVWSSRLGHKKTDEICTLMQPVFRGGNRRPRGTEKDGTVQSETSAADRGNGGLEVTRKGIRSQGSACASFSLPRVLFTYSLSKRVVNVSHAPGAAASSPGTRPSSEFSTRQCVGSFPPCL